jgi:hypothetical protein
MNIPFNFHEVVSDDWQRRQPPVVQTGQTQVECHRREHVLLQVLTRSRRVQPVTDQPGWLTKLADRALNALDRKGTALNQGLASDGELLPQVHVKESHS